MTKVKKKNIIASLLFISVIVADQFSKHLIRQNGGFYVCNKGVAFGINVSEIIFWPIWVGMFGFIILYLFKNKSEIYFFIFIISGAVSNLMDRLHKGCIIDFIDFKVWPLFNLADTFIMIGAILLVVSKIKKENKKK